MAKRLTRAAQMKADKAARKKQFDESKKAQARKGQQGMTLKQRQADDDRIGREKLIKKNSKSDSDYEKKKKKMIEGVDQRHGTNKDNLKAIKSSNRVGQAGAIVKHQTGNVINKVKGLFKKKKK